MREYNHIRNAHHLHGSRNSDARRFERQRSARSWASTLAYRLEGLVRATYRMGRAHRAPVPAALFSPRIVPKAVV